MSVSFQGQSPYQRLLHLLCFFMILIFSSNKLITSMDQKLMCVIQDSTPSLFPWTFLIAYHEDVPTA